MNCRRYFPGYKLAEKAEEDIARISHLWRHCRNAYSAEGPWLFGRFSVVDAMYAPVVMRFRSVEIDLDSVCRACYDTMHESEAVQLWLDQGLQKQKLLKKMNWTGRPN